jgi:hypothetical protein
MTSTRETWTHGVTLQVKLAPMTGEIIWGSESEDLSIKVLLPLPVLLHASFALSKVCFEYQKSCWN